MKFILSPVASNKTTTVSINGFVITVDGLDYDLSAIPVGGQAEDPGSPFIGVITRDGCKIRYEYDSALAIPHQSKEWADYTFDVTEGEVHCPIQWRA